MANDETGRPGAHLGPDDLDDLNLLIAEEDDAKAAEEEVGQAADHTVGSTSRPEFATIHLGSREIIDPRLDVEDSDFQRQPGDVVLPLPEAPPQASDAALSDTLTPGLEALAAALDDGAIGLESELQRGHEVEDLPDFGHLEGLPDERQGPAFDLTAPLGPAAGRSSGAGAAGEDDNIFDSVSAVAPSAPVSVDNTADMPFVDAIDATGDEETAIALTLVAQLTDTGGSETLEIAIEGVPAGAVLSAGIDEGGGRWTVTEAELVGLTITPPANSDVDFVLTIEATSTETKSGDTATASKSFTVTVDPVADDPTLAVTSDVTGDEDTAIPLTVNAALNDTDGSETLVVTVSGVPSGASLSAGTNQGGGVWTLAAGDIPGLTITPPANSDGDFTLTITATAIDGTDTASVVDTINVTVDAVADAPALTVADASGDEDTAIALAINAALVDTDGSESLAITVSGVPAGASLSAGTDQGGGVWTLTPAQLAGLTVTPPADSDVDFTLTVTAVSTEASNGDIATTVDTIDVTVDPVADTPTLTVTNDVTGNEDTAIPLTVNAALTDTDGSESLAITVAGVPAGASLSAGTDQGGGVWTLTPAQLAGLTVTPPADSDVDFTLTVTATSTDGTDTASTADTINVTVDPVADAPTLTVADTGGDEDTPIALSIASAVTDTDGSESLAITVSGVPAGAPLSAGTDTGGGVWTLTPAQLAGLTVTPPADSDTDFTLTVTATSTEADGGAMATTVDTIDVTVDPVADTPTLTVTNDVTGDEDTGIPLTISAALTDTDGSESLAVTVAGVPAGAALSAGTDQGGGVWTLTPAQLAGLTITPPADSDGDFTLTVTATSTDGADTASIADTINVTVDAVADAPTLTVANVTGDEDTAIPLSLSSALTDTDGSESLAITVSGVPAGATLSAGTDQGGGVWTLSPAQLAGLTVTPPADSDVDFTLTVTSVSTEANGGDTATTVDTIDVTVDPVADTPTLTVADTSGDEDTAIPLSISSALTDTDGSERLAVTISGVPSGAALSAGTDQGGGVWTLTPAQLAGLTITPPADSDVDFTLTVTSTSTEGANGDTATKVDTIDVTVDPVADAPTLTVADASGDEDTAIALSIASALTNTDGSETLAITISGVPAGAALSAGTDAGGGVWTLTPAQLAGLTITPPADDSTDFTLTVTATSTDGADTASTVDTLDVTVAGVADAPTLTVADATGNEDSAVALSINAALTDPSETLTVTVSGVPSGASLSAGTDTGGGVWTLTPAQLAGLTITPPADSDADFTLTVTATSEDDGDTADTVDTIDVTVTAVADAPTFTVADASGDEDTAIALSISSALTDTDGSESLAITISGVPAGATLSAGTDTGGGVWTLTPAQLAGLTVTPPADSDVDFTLTVTSVATEANGGDTATTVDTIDVTVDPMADAPTLTVADASGNEDTPIALSIASALTDTDGSETLAITVSGVPSGATLSAGTDTGGGVWTLTPAQLAGLTITPPADSDVDFTLTVTATSTDGADTASTVGTIDVTVDPVADAPTLTVADATGDEDTAIALTVSSALTDTDGSEMLAVTVSGVPAGATLSAGTDQGGGVWTLTPAQLAGLTVTPPADSDVDFTLTVTATSTDGADTADTVDTIDVTVNPVADAPTLTVADATGQEDTAIPLSISSALTDTDGSESLAITIAGVPAGATLSAGTDTGGGVWTLTPAQLAGLTLTPALDDKTDFTLTVTATSTDGADTATTVDTLDVTVTGVADAPTLTVADVTGNEDTAIALNINAALTDPSETLSVTVAGVPTGASLSAGTDQGGGVWTLTPAQLAGLTLTPPADSDADFTLTVTATSNDDGDTADTVDTMTVTVDPVADAPTLTVADASGAEDTATALSIASALTDTDGSETLAVTISGVPSGASLSAGTDTGGGVWTLTPAQLAGLTITPPADSDVDFTLTVTATSTDGADTATTVDTIDVTVAGVADAPTLTVTGDVTGDEDTTIALTIASALTDTDGSETLAVTISGVPSGAALSAGTDQGGGVWTLTPAQLAGLTVTPPANSDADFTLTVTAVSTETNGGDTATTVDTINVTVDAVSDLPTLTVTGTASGNEDRAEAVDVAPATLAIAVPGSTVLVSGVPVGATLSSGVDNGDGTWTVQGEYLDGLMITPPAGSSADIPLTVDVTGPTVSEINTTFSGSADGFSYGDDAFRSTSQPGYASGAYGGGYGLSGGGLRVDLGGVDDTTVNGMSGGWSQTFNVADNSTGSITLSYRMVMGAGYESDEYGEVLVSIDGTLVGVGANDYLLHVAGDGNGGSDYDSGWQTITLDLGSLSAGNHTITLGGYNNKKTFNDESTQVYFDNVSLDTQATASEAVTVDIEAGIPLTIASSLTDTDGSETLTITIEGIPTGASLSAGTDQGGGVWTLTPAQLSGLTYTPASDSDGDVPLTIIATATDSGGATSSVTDTIVVTVNPVNDAPTAETGVAALEANQTLNGQLYATDDDTAGTLTYALDTDATNGSVTVNADGSYTYTPNADYIGSDSFIYAVTDASGATSTQTITIDVTMPSNDTFMSRDEFGSASFSNNDGELAWSGDWIENDAAGTGNVRVTRGELRLTGTGGVMPSVAREVDLSNATSATLSFDWRTSSGVDTTDSIVVEISDNRGSSWNILENITGYGGKNSGTRSYDISGYTAANTQIRFRVNNLYAGSNEYFYVDDVQISQTTGPVDDTMTGGAGNDAFFGAAGDDTISGAAGNDLIEGGAGADVLDGGAGTDTLSYAAAASGVTVDLGAGSGSGGDAAGDTITNFENVIGSASADSITGDANDNVIEGGAGGDTIDGGAGTDTVSYAGSTLAVNVSLASGTGTGGDAQGDVLSNIENLTGSDWDDTLTGDAGDNVIEGGLGADVIDGGAGLDTVSYTGSSAAVTVDLSTSTVSGGDAAGDTISNIENVIGSNYDDTITGDSGDNVLSGGAGDDTLTGGAGNDTLDGGAGDDLLVGGAGDDTFLFGLGDGDDTVQGGAAGGWTDTLQLEGVTGDYLTGDWTFTLTSGSIEGVTGSALNLSQDAEGTIILADGSTVTFEGIEHVQW